MAAHHRQQPSRLFIPPNLHSQLAGQMDTRTMFSPALQTAHQPGFPPLQTGIPFQPNFSLNTPMQGSFFAVQQQQNMQQRPMHLGHRPNGSIAHGPLQPAVPMTPFGSQFPPQMLHGHGAPPNMPNGPPFIPKSRRTPSMIGGPPKAALGGPNRKVTPLAPTGQAALIAEKLKSKKLAVKLPLENSDLEQVSDGTRRSLWSRHPEPNQRQDEPTHPPRLSTAEIFPDESHKFDLPPSIDICLPLPNCWDDMKQREIDEKLEKLGIERRSDSALASIRGRASSISSPADPALLLFKLNKLQQQQSSTNSISTSPQLPYGSPGHGHSMSLAPGGSYHSPAFGALGRISGVVSPGLLGDDVPRRSPVNIHAPQGRIPAQLTVPTMPSRSESRPDFARGFGLDIPEEEEEEEAPEATVEDDIAAGDDDAVEEVTDAKETPAMSGDITAVDAPKPEEDKVEVTADVAEDSVSPVKSTHHKHPSRVSVALSVSSKRNADEPLTVTSHSRHSSLALPAIANLVNNEVNALNEWTGSESVDIVSDSESMDEWSNPSDEDRVIKERAHMATLRRLHLEMIEQEQPRRLPEFPRPPEQRPASVADDDDIISNPSDEERKRATFSTRPVDGSYPSSGLDSASRSSRPLPPVPHSRDPSYQYSYYGSLPAHSREPSANQLQRIISPEPELVPSQALQVPPQALVPPKKDLNPFAKPFVFGGRSSFAPTASPSVPVSVNSEAASSPAQSSAPVHSRNPSLVAAKTLNAAAQEFKPSGFTFQAPEGVPKLAFPEPVAEPSRPLPPPPIIVDPRASQGREKRLKASVSDIENESDSELGEGHDSMASFRFPIASDHATFAKSAPTSPGPSITAGRPTASMLSVNSKPFTFSGFSSMPPVLPPLLGQEQRSLTDTLNVTDFLSIDATRGSALGDDRKSPDLTLPSIQKQKRAPIPLDFTHPVSTNKAPAGLFKNVAANNLDSTRTPRSFGGLYDRSDDRSDISLDDLSVPPISGTMNRRPAHQPEDLDASEGSEDDYGFNRSEDADAESAASSAGSGSRPESPLDHKSYVQPEIASYSQGLRLEDRIEMILRQKMDAIMEVVASQRQGNYISNNTDELVREAMAMFRTQLRDSASKAMDGSVMDASGELDFKMIADIVEQGHAESRRAIQDDIVALVQTVQKSDVAERSLYELGGEVRELKATLSASNNAIRHQLASIGESTRNHGQSQDRDSLVADLLAALAPHFVAIRSEPIDYDGLTAQLSQAVKPHISQLIDLASDKRETAGLIVERLTPILEGLQTGMSASDTANLVSAITASVNRAIAPIDTYAIKEQVADLVVERLDSRLATRDIDVSRNFSEIKGKMTDQITPVLTRFDLLDKAIQNMSCQQSESATLARETSLKRESSDKLLLELSEKLSEAVRLSAEVAAKVQNSDVSVALEQQFTQVNNAVGALKASQENSTKNFDELMELSRETSAKYATIPELILSFTGSQDSAQVEILAQLKALASSSQETRKLVSQNSDLQSQLSKARSQHGQVRVQYETTNAKFSVKENECDELKARISELETVAATRDADFVSLEKRNAEQEQAMHAALERLKASDVDAQTRQEKSSKLEKENKDLTRRSLEAQSKIESLEMQISFFGRDKENMQRTLKSAEEERDRLVAQQAQLDDLRRTSEQVEALAKMIAKNDSEELTELRHARDQSKVLQVEHDALKKRFRDQETKVNTAERNALNTRQSLEQAQKRATDWEEKARLFEAEVERLTTALDQAEQTKGQLDADFSLAKLQLEEKEAEDRIAKDRERKLAEEVANLKTQLKALNSDLEEERKANRPASKNTRPTSRSSTTYEASEPPTPKMNGKTLPARSPTPKSSTWDSIHAPRTKQVGYMGGGGRPAIHSQRTSYYSSRAASPAPSAISTVTQDAEGWFS